MSPVRSCLLAADEQPPTYPPVAPGLDPQDHVRGNQVDFCEEE